jgi:hypothetical protein
MLMHNCWRCKVKLLLIPVMRRAQPWRPFLVCSWRRRGCHCQTGSVSAPIKRQAHIWTVSLFKECLCTRHWRSKSWL